MSSSFKRRGRKNTSSAAISPSSLSTQNISASTNAQSPSHPRSPQRTVSSSNLPGTKPWTNGLTLTSFGLREIDSFFFSSGGEGGGIPLMSMILLEEDRLTDDLARSLCRYWCAEGVAQRQMVLLASMLPSIDDDASLQNLDEQDNIDTTNSRNYEGSTPQELQHFIHSLPRNLHLDKFRAKEAKRKKQSSTTTTDTTSTIDENQMMSSNNREAISAIIEEEDDEEEEENSNTEESSKDEGLVNAWQYRKSVQDKRSGMSGTSNNSSGTSNSVGDGVYCHSYNLSKRLSDQFTEESEDNPLDTNTRIIDCSKALSSTATNGNMEYQEQGVALFCSLWRNLQSTISTHPNTVIRLFLHRLPVGQGAVALPLLIAKIRKENLPVIVLTTIRPWKWLSSAGTNNNKLDVLASLRSTTDTTLSLDSFSSLRTPPPPEFSLLQGILTVRKCAAFTVAHYTDTVTWKRPLAERFGVKRDGRKVTVQLLHLPPEEYSKGGSSTSGVRSGGGSVNTDDKKKHSAGGCSSLAGGASLDF